MGSATHTPDVMEGDAKVRVLVVDDEEFLRSIVRERLEIAGYSVEEASNGSEALGMLESTGPYSVLLTDIRMPVMDGIAATRELAKRGTSTRVLILTMHSEDEYLVALLEAGAAGYLVKNAADRELVDAVRAVAAGDSYVQPSAALTLARNVSRRAKHADEREQYNQLSERERDVLVHVAGGYSASEIGERLFISPKTVETYKQRITEKLGLSHRADYVQFCLRLGLLKTT